MNLACTAPTGNDTCQAWREGDHDDLVLAVAVACWYAVHYMHGRIGLTLL